MAGVRLTCREPGRRRYADVNNGAEADTLARGYSLSPVYKFERLPENTANMPVADAIRKARMQVAIDFMNANLHRSISVNELANSVRLSASHFARLFKAETGIAPGQYLTSLRMERAGQLLATSFLSIKEIMGAVGYKSRGNFIRFFRKHFHATPSEYRQQTFQASLIQQSQI
jgi:transcriptional regulator GlxA family with amidase domain